MVFPFIHIHVSAYACFREAAVLFTNIYVEKCSLDDLLKPNGDISIFFSYSVLYLYITIYFSPKLGNQTFSPLLECLSYTVLETNPGNRRASSTNKERCVCFTEEIRAV